MLKSPLIPSPTGGLSSAFSPFSDSPDPPAHFRNNPPTSTNRHSGRSDSLAPPPSPYPQQIEPSPVDSNGTESTEIDEDSQDGGASTSPSLRGESQYEDPENTSQHSANSARVRKINTHLPPKVRFDSTEDAPQSVIHAPAGFKDFDDANVSQQSLSEHSEKTVVSPATPEAATGIPDDKLPAMTSIKTNISRHMDRPTPRAQTRQEIEDEWKRRSEHAAQLEDLFEPFDNDGVEAEKRTDSDSANPTETDLVDGETSDQVLQHSLHIASEQLTSLRTALSECWTLCNTLSNLSSSHRQRTFQLAGKQEIQEQAWHSCWRLCQQLYDSRKEDHASHVLPTLELCRGFCQSLFDVRQKVDEASDSVLRVSFELNNHLYTQDRDTEDVFNERTLDFYITLCHRLMKQRTSLPHETDALLRACWTLAEMLFNLRQGTREGRMADEELLGSAVQACWELCDLFREGWTQIRPDRGTPRPTQTKFSSQSSFQTSSSRSKSRSNSSLSHKEHHVVRSLPPETPTTIFDDVTSADSSPDSVNIPNILVLGPASNGNTNNSLRGTQKERWSSNASVLSAYSDSVSSQRTSSTATAGSEGAHLARLRYLLLKAGMHTGFSRSDGQLLPAHVHNLSNNAFGTLPWQMKVLGFYKKLIAHDKSLLTVHTLPARRLAAVEMAKSVKWLGSAEQWAWMRDLYRLVFGFGIDEAEQRDGHIQV